MADLILPFVCRADKPAKWVFHLLDFRPDSRTYVLRLESAGRNPRSLGYACTIETVRLLERRPRVAEFGHDRDKDWRKNPALYY